MTEKQKEHSRLYREYRTGQELRRLSMEDGEDINIHIGTPNSGATEDSPRFSFYSILKHIVCEADAIVLGKPESRFSQLTADEDFVFTDYELAIEEVLKDDPNISKQGNNNITVTRPGGFIRLNNRNIRATDQSFKPLEMGERYVLFLRFIPATGAYRALNSKSSFKIRSEKIFKLTNENLASELENGSDANSLMTQVRNIVAGSCIDK